MRSAAEPMLMSYHAPASKFAKPLHNLMHGSGHAAHAKVVANFQYLGLTRSQDRGTPCDNDVFLRWHHRVPKTADPRKLRKDLCTHLFIVLANTACENQ
jgi:hypothetical protein